jgi:hypothetical protein
MFDGSVVKCSTSITIIIIIVIIVIINKKLSTTTTTTKYDDAMDSVSTILVGNH